MNKIVCCIMDLGRGFNVKQAVACFTRLSYTQIILSTEDTAMLRCHIRGSMTCYSFGPNSWVPLVKIQRKQT